MAVNVLAGIIVAFFAGSDYDHNRDMEAKT